MNKLTILLVFCALSYATGDERTIGFLGSVTPDPIRLPSVVPGDGSVAVSESVSKPESFFDKLTAPLSLLSGSFPCLGQSSLKAGKCMAFDTCTADGGFGDGKGLCLGDVVCCVKPIKCGEFSLLNNTVLANPGFPKATNQAGTCDVKLVKPFGISHIKLLIKDMELAQPNPKTGRCDVDSLSVSGGVLPGFGLGKICGLAAETHIYIPTVLDLADIFIKFELADDGAIARRWLIRAEMIEEKSPERPPSGCTQYFRESSGLLTSLNFDLAKNVGLGNIDGLKYGVCIAAKPGCKIEFTDLFFDLGGEVTSHNMNLVKDKLNQFSRAIENNRAPNRGHVAYRPIVSHHRPTYRPYSVPNYTGYTPVRPLRPFRPNYEQSSLSHAQTFPYAQFLYHMHPYYAMYAAQNGGKFYPANLDLLPSHFKVPMKKPEIGDKLDLLKLGELGGDLNKLDKLESLVDSNKLSLPQGACMDQDFLILPTPGDLTSAVHCGNDLHFGQKFVSSPSLLGPFIIEVSNTGKVHGKGFALQYNTLC